MVTVVVVLVLAGLLLLAGLATYKLVGEQVTNDPNEIRQMRELLLDAIPIGTPVDRAQAPMAERGFTCKTVIERGEWRDWTGNPPRFGVVRSGISFVSCGRLESAPFFDKSWRVALVYEDGKVSDILVTRYDVGL